MAFPELESLCIQIKTFEDQICINFPGGATICAQAGYDFGDGFDITKSAFGSVNAAMAPLAPVFEILDVAVKMFACIKAIPKSLGPPPDPSKLLQCIPDLQKAIDIVLKLIPQLSIPAFVKSLINAVIAFLKGLRARLAILIKRATQIDLSYQRAAELDNPNLVIVLDCAKSNLDAQLANLNASMTPINQLLGIVNAFMQIAQLGCIPAMGAIGGLGEDILTPIDAIIEILITIRDAVPDIPAIDLGGGSDC